MSTTDRRVVLIKPADQQHIAGVRFGDAEQGAKAMRRFREVTGITPAVFFADDICIDQLTAEQLRDLTDRAETQP